jgi:hypothetical protein
MDESRSLLCCICDAGLSKLTGANDPTNSFTVGVAGFLYLMKQTQACGFLVVVFHVLNTFVIGSDCALVAVVRKAILVADQSHRYLLPPFP